MSVTTFYFFHQQEGKESKWEMSLSTSRAQVLLKQPAFSTILDLTTIPEDRDWSKVRYRGPFYADFDAGDDLGLVCEQFKNFLAKLASELDFDISQARMYASGSKGFHVEIPQECFMPKVPTQGTPWLAYVYRNVAESLIVDTLDLNVYTGKRGRQWRTSNVQRENKCYKVPLTLEEALTMTPELYRELISSPRYEHPPTPPSVNSAFVMLFERSRDKVVTQMRNKKKRIDKANLVLDPWRKAGKTPPSIERVMAGEGLSETAGFQAISMQMAIYATSVGMALPEFLDRCKGLVERHVSDGVRYNTPARRRDELSRMWEYMSENSLYDFEVDPVVRLLKSDVDTSDLGVMETHDRHDRSASTKPSAEEIGGTEDGESSGPGISLDNHRGLRRGFFMNTEGMFRRDGEVVNPVSRATLRNVDAIYDVEKPGFFMGYEFDLCVKGRANRREITEASTFTSAQNIRKFLADRQISFQGNESDAAGLMDIIAEKSDNGGRVYVYPREGFFVINHPEVDEPTPVKVFLTKNVFMSSVDKDDPLYFQLKYRPTAATSAYDIDIHWAPELDLSMEESIRDIFIFNKPTVVADMVGWFTACHYRAIYLRLFSQFPLLQVYGEAGSGKSQSVRLMAHMHWYLTDRISIKSAMSFTNFALDAHASSSTSAPLLIDEYKPRELRSVKSRFEKIKDLFKASYIAADVGERGTVNKADNSLALIKTKATAPIVFMGEAIEMETAIIERSVCVPFSKSGHGVKTSTAFTRLQRDPTALSSIGRVLVEQGFRINLEKMRDDMQDIIRDIELRMPSFDDASRRRMAPRMIYNRAVIIHGLRCFKHALQTVFGERFDADVDALINARDSDDDEQTDSLVQIHAMSEISKVISRIALMSRDRDAAHEMQNGKDYMVGHDWVEMRVEKAYDKYRVYCAAIRDTPLFDTLEAFAHAINSFSPCIDRVCSSSTLRASGSRERIVRFSLESLAREGIQTFKSA